MNFTIHANGYILREGRDYIFDRETNTVNILINVESITVRPKPEPTSKITDCISLKLLEDLISTVVITAPPVLLKSKSKVDKPAYRKILKQRW